MLGSQTLNNDHDDDPDDDDGDDDDHDDDDHDDDDDDDDDDHDDDTFPSSAKKLPKSEPAAASQAPSRGVNLTGDDHPSSIGCCN